MYLEIDIAICVEVKGRAGAAIGALGTDHRIG
jgi:hypothetical protein